MLPSAALIWAMNFSTERSLQAAVGGRFETLVGVVPDTSFSQSEASVAMSLIPVAGIQVQSDRTEFAALYRPRVYWRFPNPLSMARPLLLHQLALEHQYLLSPRTTWHNRFQGSIGEVDYTLSSLVFDPTQPSVPNNDVTTLVRFDGSTGVSHQLTSRATTGIDLDAGYNSPLDTEDENGFIRSFEAGGEPYYGYRLTPRDQATVGAGISYAWFDQESTFVMVTPTLMWGHDFTRQTAGILSAGVAWVEVLENTVPTGPEPGETDVSPTGDVRVKSRVYGERGKYVDAGANAQYKWYFDPVVGRPVQRVGGGFFGGVLLEPDWTVGAAVSFYTTVGENTFEPTDQESVVRHDQTMLRIDVPVSYDINRLLGLEFGVRSNLRGPPIADGLAFTDVEVWFYGALRLVFDPKDKQAGWTP